MLCQLHKLQDLVRDAKMFTKMSEKLSVLSAEVALFQLCFFSIRPSFMGIVFGSGILLDLVLFANRIIAEPKS